MTRDDENARNHGYEKPEDVGSVLDIPRISGDAGLECPNCGCKQTYHIMVMVENRLLKGGKGVGNYIGCPACPYASPMMTTAIK